MFCTNPYSLLLKNNVYIPEDESRELSKCNVCVSVCHIIYLAVEKSRYVLVIRHKKRCSQLRSENKSLCHRTITLVFASLAYREV